MAIYSSADLGFSIIPEATQGTVPTTGAVRSEVPVKTGAALPDYTANDIVSETMRPNRAGNGSRRGNGSGEGSFEMALQKCAATDLLLQSVVSGVWDDNALKGGKTDTSFSTIVKAASNMHFIYGGCICSSFTLEMNAAEGISASFDYAVMSRTPSATDNGIAVTPTGETLEWSGAEVEIDVDGAALQFTSATLEITQDRPMRNVLGSNVPIGTGASGIRQVTLTVTAYRESIAIDSAITGLPQPITILIGGVDSYSFHLPAAIGSVPSDVTEDDLLVTVTFTAKYDEGQMTDVIIEKFQTP